MEVEGASGNALFTVQTQYKSGILQDVSQSGKFMFYY